MTKLTLHFPKQFQDYKEASRFIRSSGVFKEFVVGKSKDRRYLHLDFKTEEKYSILKPILFHTLQKLEYNVEEFTE